MVKRKTTRFARDDWLKAALDLCTAGIDNLKVAPLATHLGVTTGSFYWHFKNRRELLEELLGYWEYEMTNRVAEAARQYSGSPAERILFVMESVMTGGMARYDLPIWQWAQSDTRASRVFKRALKKRFSTAAWMFSEAGFSAQQAEIRGHMMVTYMMGEATLIPKSVAKHKEFIRLKHAILTAPPQ